MVTIRKRYPAVTFSDALRVRAKSVGRRLARRDLSLSVCESCTAGMLGAVLTATPGSSRYFYGGIIAYADRIKDRIVGVRRATLRDHGAVSAETCGEMAGQVRKKFHSDLGVAVTGIAGPRGGSREKPVGLVYVTVTGPGRTETARCRFIGNRHKVRVKSCWAALEMIGIFLDRGGHKGNRK
jgi:PncC family amidohydrolase